MNFQLIPISELHESPTNPRKHFDAVALEELAASIRETGLVHPLLVRPLSEGFEVVAGHRRLRASRIAQLAEVPCSVVDMDARRAAETQLAENAQREDVTPLEEADALDVLVRLHRATPEELAARLGKSITYVRTRLALAPLGPIARELLQTKRLGIVSALQLTRIGSAEAREECARRLTALEGEIPVWQVRQHVWALTLQLNRAPWQLDDSQLVRAAGACTKCPKRTGAQTLLQIDGIGHAPEDACLDAACWESKREAHVHRIRTTSASKGWAVSDVDRIALRPGTVDVDSRPTFQGAPDFTWGSLLVGDPVPYEVQIQPSGHVAVAVSIDAALKQLGGRGGAQWARAALLFREQEQSPKPPPVAAEAPDAPRTTTAQLRAAKKVRALLVEVLAGDLLSLARALVGERLDAADIAERAVPDVDELHAGGEWTARARFLAELAEVDLDAKASRPGRRRSEPDDEGADAPSIAHADKLAKRRRFAELLERDPKLTQEDLAERLGVAVRTVSRWMREDGITPAGPVLR